MFCGQYTVKDGLVIGLKIKQNETWDRPLMFACHTKTDKHGNEAIGEKVP
jgi:hypothetical protein